MHSNEDLTLYQKVRNDIISGELKSSEKITETKLAKKYDVSRTPVREVIKQLELEYFIKDSYIFIPTTEEYRNLFEMRILLETYALEKAGIIYTEDDLLELKSYTNIDINVESEEAILEMNDNFHQKIINASNNPFILESYQKLKSFIYLFSKTVINKRRSGLIEEHVEIVEALYERKVDKAKQLLENHLQKDLEFSLYYLSFKNEKSN
ncbi:GntR family transcriptional regulator [Staphylococcus simiae]|uniref:Transcriptional regulator, GntR family protein n=1 Tax=Staphylococcus simiae CCM 7213 = CCUG 51256 TaxID=911238 RepID=G5JJS4_9STAP|nr:GntR family transcriptional regulator [Staphylococcus simiae]EHJ07581.1 transcriptional regulator, GntR family protein [Staphylococcus simiae CCM 7213 = CCUG 51256]PNZ14675.1 GntR family transcriptional regulator [Staphylococcus simiae]SNV55063.1 gluconate operon transcriptional repressor [Staphylococcus simiae]